jgi:ATP-dependent DNA helicase Q4
VLYITAERLFMEDLSKFGRKISMVCVDEIHCASEWSHNFRPAYLMLHEMIKEKLGSQTRVLGLTATATRSCQREVARIFDIKFPEHLITQTDLSRINLQLAITRDHEKTRALMNLLRSEAYRSIHSILLFATQRKTTEQVASYLSSNGIKSEAYHAGKSDEQRAYIQKQFTNNKVRVLCCTIAYSMGIDKADIQSVIHYDIPRSIENYVQEIGRAGRDGKLARCHMFLSNDDFY